MLKADTFDSESARTMHVSTAKLSPQGRAILERCAQSSLRLRVNGGADIAGCLYIRDLMRLRQGSRNVVKASVSRSLRRLWRAGWVELLSEHGSSLTNHHANAAADLEAAERDPEGVYARARAVGGPGLFLWATPQEYLSYLHSRADELMRGRRMALVYITNAGRQRLTEINLKLTARRDPGERSPPLADPGLGRQRALE
jgi:hypothetical protein